MPHLASSLIFPRQSPDLPSPYGVQVLRASLASYLHELRGMARSRSGLAREAEPARLFKWGRSHVRKSSHPPPTTFTIMPSTCDIELDTESYKGKIHIETGLFIGGKFVDPIESKELVDVINPSTGLKIASVQIGTSKDVNFAVDTAWKTYRSAWGLKVPAAQRGKLLARLADLLERDLDQFAALETLNAGKPFAVAQRSDIAGSIRCIRYFAGYADKIHGDTIETHDKRLAYTRREPYGVVPSELTPLSALKFAELVNEAGFPPGVFNIVNGYGPTVGQTIIEHPDIQKVAFTGSTLVGRKVLEASARTNLKVVTLELGGKSPSIVFDDCDLEQTIRWVGAAMYDNMGQSCVAGTRIFVQAGIYDKFIGRFTELVKTLAKDTGDPFAKATRHGPQVSQNQFDRIMSFIESGKKDGATVHLGGDRHGSEGYFVQPTIFTNVKPEMKIVQEEIFGPVASVLKFETEEEVIEAANKTTYGLACLVFSENIKRALRVAHQLEAGSAFINMPQMTDAAIPFGGFKESGIGREHGEGALETYTQVKSVHVNLGEMRALSSLPLDDDIVHSLMTFCPDFRTLQSLILVSKAFFAVYESHPRSITRCVAYNVVGPALPQALRVLRFPTSEWARQRDANPDELADTCPEDHEPSVITCEEKNLLQDNAEMIARFENIYSFRFKDRNSRTSVLTPEESQRFRRAAYRILLYSEIFTSRGWDVNDILDMEADEVMDFVKQRTAFFMRFPTDELLEIWSVTEYMRHIYLELGIREESTDVAMMHLLTLGPEAVVQAWDTRNPYGVLCEMDVDDFSEMDEEPPLFSGFYDAPLQKIWSVRKVQAPKEDDSPSKWVLDTVNGANDTWGLQLLSSANWGRFPCKTTSFWPGNLARNISLWNTIDQLDVERQNTSNWFESWILGVFDARPTDANSEWATWTPDDSYCKDCIAKFLKGNAWRWLLNKKIESGWNPPENCWYGYNCRTQTRVSTHAAKLNEPDPEPFLPPELEWLIFEFAAKMHPQCIVQCIRVARRVRIWLEPLLYGKFLVEDSTAEHIRATVSLDTMLGILSAKPPDFLRRHIHHLALSTSMEEDVLARLLQACSNVKDLCLWSGGTSLATWLQVRRLENLERLSVNMQTLFIDASDGETYLPPTVELLTAFRRITHLDLFGHISHATWPVFAALPALTNLAFNDDFFPETLDATFERCPNLRVLVVIYNAWEDYHCKFQEREDVSLDARVCLVYCGNFTGDWLEGLAGGVDFWTRAEQFLERKRLRQVPETHFFVDIKAA
ncbi:unnamed protein product [Mycena citricolor]|uniref:Aldehyde dehydrogenase domain-containing protein n=1 Tax=Mycena citricolor TaxID=2018698 RepID=A0AAD2HKC3_9AGAR|nr:unnamed protein product [Mycena citricolor]